MTLRELWMLVIRYWMLTLAIIVACTLLGFGCAFLQDCETFYKADAKIVAGSNLNSVAGFAENAARGMQAELQEKKIDASVTTASALMTITISATGPDSQGCMEAANAIAESANESATEIYAQNENPYKGEVSRAVESTPAGSTVASKYALYGFVCGVLLALVALVLLDFKKRPAKTAESAQSATELPVLDVLPSSNEEKLLANVRFAAARLGNADVDFSVLVIPVGQEEAGAKVASLLENAAASDGLTGIKVRQTVSLLESMDGAYAAQDADMVIVVVQQWKDSMSALVSCVDELRFADAKIAGLVFSKSPSVAL